MIASYQIVVFLETLRVSKPFNDNVKKEADRYCISDMQKMVYKIARHQTTSRMTATSIANVPTE